MKSLSFRIEAAEGAAGSVIQRSGLPELDRMPLFFFLCRAGEKPDAWTCAKLDGTFKLDGWENVFEPEKWKNKMKKKKQSLKTSWNL